MVFSLSSAFLAFLELLFELVVLFVVVYEDRDDVFEIDVLQKEEDVDLRDREENIEDEATIFEELCCVKCVGSFV